MENRHESSNAKPLAVQFASSTAILLDNFSALIFDTAKCFCGSANGRMSFGSCWGRRCGE
ncbi:MAG: hypothetical protein DB853_00700 [Candidatus Brocadia sp.]|nr:MAG: hypothetical protein DB853_00700 [Candidatus Brocadia sp.]